MRIHYTSVLVLSICAGLISCQADETRLPPAPGAVVIPAQNYRALDQAVIAQPDGSIIAEAEEFIIQDAKGWQAKSWGENYYAATFANCFLSRKAFLGAPATCDRTVATINVNVPAAGKYLALVRYEAAYRFETQFTVRITQDGATVLDRKYGARANPKIWAFGQKIKPEVAWGWGAVENVVWEGHDAHVDLQPGTATITLIADRQSGDAANRNIDLVMLTTDEADVLHRIENERYLPLDGLLTQAGDVHARLTNHSSSPVTLTFRPCRQHSPYWVHLRSWPESILLTADDNQTTDWLEVGSLLDSLNDGQWAPTAEGDDLDYTLEIGLRNAAGEIESINRFRFDIANPELTYHADTRYSRRVGLTQDVLFKLLADLKSKPLHGQRPRRTVIHGYTFGSNRENSPEVARAVEEFVDLFALATILSGGHTVAAGTPQAPRGYTDALYSGYDYTFEAKTTAATKKLKELTEQGIAGLIHTVSLGDEIGLPTPEADDHEGFRNWAQSRGLTLTDLIPGGDGEWSDIQYNPDDKSNPRVFYYSRRYRQEFGIAAQKGLTDLIRQYLPNAGIGANYSPHHSSAYVGNVHKWVTLFREEGMTQPWSEDYIWQLPVGTPQMSALLLDTFRAGTRPHPQQKIHFYVMPHTPGNTPAQWRRQFYSDLAHGMKVVNLFEFRPVQTANTENHTSDPAMFHQVLKSFYEMGGFEDIIQDGQVRWGNAGFWMSETGDAWDNSRNPLAAAKRSLYIAMLHQQLATDIVVEADAVDGTLDDYAVLYLADQNVSTIASQKIAEWVHSGGKLFATAGAGMYDQFNRPNNILRALLGVEESSFDLPEDSYVQFIKQDIRFAKPIDVVTWTADHQTHEMPIFAVRSRITATSADVRGTFTDGSPAVTRRAVGQGSATYVAFAPGLSYFYPAIPRRPVDRGSTDDAMSHFMPTDFDSGAAALIGSVAAGTPRPVERSHSLVDARMVESESGIVIPLINWTDQPVRNLIVTINTDRSISKVESASGRRVSVRQETGRIIVTLNLKIADALILR
ncbi:MAG: hypothetical protein CMJ49_02080 [Planctomycetaceae bacterium]|nr:hypothetical protein [Planctomycetaceae bacterium]